MFCWLSWCGRRSASLAPVVPGISTSTWRGCLPAVRQRFPSRGGRPALLLRSPILLLDGLPLPHRDGTVVRRGVQLPCGGARSTSATCEKKRSLSLLIYWVQNQSHGAGERLPLRVFGCELFAPERCEAIILGALAFVGKFPGGRDPALGFQTMEGRIQ